MLLFVWIRSVVTQAPLNCPDDRINVKLLMNPPHDHFSRTHPSSLAIGRMPALTVDFFMACGPNHASLNNPHLTSCSGSDNKCGKTRAFSVNGSPIFTGNLEKCLTREDHPTCKITVDFANGVFDGEERKTRLGTLHTLGGFRCDMANLRNVLVECNFRCDNIDPSCEVKSDDPQAIPNPQGQGKRSMGCTCREDPDVVDICESDNPCKNGAECVSQGREANCICTKGFSGETCNLVDAKWQEWSSCTGICGPEGTRTRECVKAGNPPGKTCDILRREVVALGEDPAAASKQACTLPNECPKTHVGVDTSDTAIDALLVGERPPDDNFNRLDVALIFAGVLFVFVGVVIIAQTLCRSDTAKKAPEEGGAMSEAERKAFEVKLRREVMEEMEAEEKAEYLMAKRIDDIGEKRPSTGPPQSTRAAPLKQETSRSTRDRSFSTTETARSRRDAPGGPWARGSAQSMRDAPCSPRTREGPTSARAPSAQSIRDAPCSPRTREGSTSVRAPSAQSMRDAPCSPRAREGSTSVRAPSAQSIRANETSRSTLGRNFSTEATRSMRDAPSMRCAPLTVGNSKRAPMSAIRESRVLTERNF